MKKNAIHLIIFCILHFCVDFICAASLVLIADLVAGNENLASDTPYVFLVYNCLAFLLQPVFGLWIDRFDGANGGRMFKAFLLLSIGTLLIAWAVFMLATGKMSATMMFVCAAIFGISNALFHVSAGKQVLMFSNRATPGGLFVSTGALGIGLASVILIAGNASFFIESLFVLIPFIVVPLTLIYFFGKLDLLDGKYKTYSFSSIRWYAVVALLLCAAIGVRSFLGFYSKMSDGIVNWVAIFLLAVAAFMGKAIGGLLLDLGGPFFTIITSSVVSTVLSVFLKNSYVDYVFILSFNLLMPVTLDAIRRCFPKREGFSFGLAAAFLSPGYLLGNLLKPYGTKEIIIPIVCFITGAMLVVVYWMKKKDPANERDN